MAELVVTPSLVRALLDRNQRELWRIGELPPPTDDDDLELQHRRQHREQLVDEIKNFQAWLDRARAMTTPPADPPPGADRSQPSSSPSAR